MKILNFGSLNIDFVYSLDHFVRKGETISSRELNIFSGGKGLNQSVALGRAGACVYHAGAVGPDGDFLLELMNGAGVDTKFVKRLEDVRTGNAIIQKDKSGDNCIILYGGANQAITKAQIDETIAAFDAGDFLVMQNEINEMPYIMERAYAQGMKLVLNPSPMDEKILKMPLQYVSYFVLNEIEAGQILGLSGEESSQMDGAKLAEELCSKFPQAKIVLTLGGEGSVYYGDGELLRQPAFKVQAVDTTAAGDTFTGYFIAGLIEKLPVKEAMELAAKAAAITVSRAGAAPSIPVRDEVK